MSKPIVAAIAVLATAVLAGASWYYYQADASCAKVAGQSLPVPEELKQVKGLQLEALKRLANARELEDAARKLGDSGKIAEATEVVKRTAAEEKAAADLVRKHEAAYEAMRRAATNSSKTTKVDAATKSILSCKNAA